MARKAKNRRSPARPSRRRRALGQHFLAPGPVPEELVREFAPLAGEPVLEVGPGRGVLTAALLAAGARVLAIEIDAGLAADLVANFPGGGHLDVVRADVMEVDLPGLLRGSFAERPVRCLSSLPYSSGTAILERLCDAMPPLTEIVVLLQKEVVERAVAEPGSRPYGYLSVVVRSRCEARAGRLVRPGAFQPPPRVQSRVLHLRPLAQPPIVPETRPAFLRLAGKLFAHPRKTLANNLKAAGLDVQALESAGAAGDLGRRPGQWRVEELAALHARLAPRPLC